MKEITPGQTSASPPLGLLERWPSWTAFHREWNRFGVTTIVAALGFFVAWEAVVKLFEVPRYIVPAPSLVIRQFIRNFSLIWHYTLVTATETLVGYLIAVSISVPLAMAVAFSRSLQETFYP